MMITWLTQFVSLHYFEIIMNYLTKSIRALHYNGVCIREIARRLKVAPSTVYRVIHGHTFSSLKRCPRCGARLKGKDCIACQLRDFLKLANIYVPDKWDNYIDWNGKTTFIQLELRPPEYARYLIVRKRKEEELNRIQFE